MSDSASPTTERPASETVLLVEDDAAVRSLARRMLQRAGYAVVEASGGDEALRLVEDGLAFDLLITDSVMPGVSGRLLAERLIASRPALRVLIMSGYEEDPSLRSGALAGRVGFLHKPFTAA